MLELNPRNSLARYSFGEEKRVARLDTCRPGTGRERRRGEKEDKRTGEEVDEENDRAETVEAWYAFMI